MQHFSNPIITTNEKKIIILAILSFEEYMGMTVNGEKQSVINWTNSQSHFNSRINVQWWKLAKWFLKNHNFIHVNSTVAGKYNKHKQDGGQLWFPIRMILANVDLQVTSILPMNFWVNCPFGSGEKVQNRFSRWPSWLPFGISYRNDF